MLGFTRKERSVLLFLVIAFVAGLVLFVYRERWQPLPELEKPEDFSSQSSGIIGESAVQESTVRKAERAFTINTATREELIELPGIGPVMAERILDYRERKGGFKHIEELIHVKGIGPKTLEKLKRYFISNQSSGDSSGVTFDFNP